VSPPIALCAAAKGRARGKPPSPLGKGLAGMENGPKPGRDK
jgi:hypothetical protein